MPPDSAAAARAACAWFDVDRVPGDPATTAWKRRARLAQARWREARGWRMGAHPYGGGPGATPVGSRLELAFARESGANFLTPGVRSAVRDRLAAPERHQTLLEDRLWADLLSSMPLCFNLFGDLAADPSVAARAWWPDLAGGRATLRFEHSPGRRDPSLLGNRTAFDAAFEVELATGSRAVVGVEVKYHEHAVVERPPRPEALARYVAVTERAGLFGEGWRDAVVGTALQQVWLDHLLVLAMLQHPSGRWTAGRFVLVYPAENPSFASVAARYARLLVDRSTFEARTLEDLLATPGALAEEVVAAIRERYLAPP